MSIDEDRPETNENENAQASPEGSADVAGAGDGATGSASPTNRHDDAPAGDSAPGSAPPTDRNDDVPGRALAAEEQDEPPADDGTDAAADASETSEEGIRDLLRGALGRSEPEIPDVLRGVQRKIRQRSGGKFYADGWSTARQPPISTYLITSLVMLAILFAIWAVFSPLSGEPAPVGPPAPVNVIPGTQYRTP
jgi:hypothetical protein